MNSPSAAAAPPTKSSGDIVDWRPEDNAFWEATGKRIAYRNLVDLGAGAALRLRRLGDVGDHHRADAQPGLPVHAGRAVHADGDLPDIAGATMRIPASFLIRLAGGRNTIFLTTAMLLRRRSAPASCCSTRTGRCGLFQLMALWSGVGGGNFASSMSNISTFFPKRLQGTALGINAGIGNFGVTTMQSRDPAGDDRGAVRRVSAASR